MWKDSSRYKEAAEKMKLTAKDLYEMNIVDKIIKEPIEMQEEDFMKVVKNIRKEIKSEILTLSKMSSEEIIEDRYQKFRNIKGFKNV